MRNVSNGGIWGLRAGSWRRAWWHRPTRRAIVGPGARVAAGALVISLAWLVVGCATGVPVGSRTTTLHTTPTSATAPTPAPTPTPPAAISSAQATQACGATDSSGAPIAGRTFYQVGDLIINIQVTNVDYPSVKLPDDLPLKPYQVTQVASQPLVNPNLSNGYFVTLCDAGTTAHTIDGLSVKIDTFSPYSGPLNIWDPCNSAYIPSRPGIGGGCGGGFTTEESLAAAFQPHDAAGASVESSFVRSGIGANEQPFPPLPVAVQPGQNLYMNLGLTAPTVAGFYLFSISAIADGAQTPYAPMPTVVLLDSAAQVWSGKACEASAMQAQIPAASSAGFICPVL